jgi:Helix-turn-helix domain
MSDNSENANPAGQGRVHANERTFVTVTVPQLAVKYQAVSAAPKRPWMIHVEREVMDNPKLSPEARVLYAILRGYQGKNCREPFPSIKTLQAKVGVWDAIYRYLNELCRAGLIRRIKEGVGGKFSRNKYEFLGPLPTSENRDTVEGLPTSDLTESVENRVGENRIRQTASVRIPIIKDTHSLKESQREREFFHR